MDLKSTKIVILTGAGISAESGLGTFRDKGGIWQEYDLSKVATPEGFQDDPDQVHAFYNARRRNAFEAKPNAAHKALAQLEREWPGEVLVVTQNVDDLHERAGSRAVLHMHGELARALCTSCGTRWDAPVEMHVSDVCTACGTQGVTRPDIVWFGEMPYHMDEIAEALSQVELFAAIGTSGQVWPAAGFVEEARRNGAHCVEINLDASDVSAAFHEHLLGPASETVPAWVEQQLK